jgi:hypothetical protein
MGATNLVERMEGDCVMDILEELAMNKEIQKVTEKQFEGHKVHPLPPPPSEVLLATIQIQHSPMICSNARFPFLLTWIQSQQS